MFLQVERNCLLSRLYGHQFAIEMSTDCKEVLNILSNKSKNIPALTP
jgi:hypothetical protein